MRCHACGSQNAVRAKFCSECGTRLTGAAGETRKTVTVLFADMSGSTALGERLDPEALRKIVERYFDAMRSEIERHGGTVEKFIGDAVMAVFGIPAAHEDDAIRAIRAALDIHRALHELNFDLEDRHHASISVRVGINTGEVVTRADVADRQRLVTGDAVNVAARLEQAAAAGVVLIGTETYRLVRAVVEVEAREPLDLKGKSEPVSAFRVIRLVEQEPSIARPRATPFVGRDRERRLLIDAIARARSRRSCQMVTVIGHAGVGKSRLVDEVLASTDGTVGVFSGRCLPYGEGITFWPMLEIIRSIAGIEATDDVARVQAKLGAVLRGQPDADGIGATIASVLGFLPAGGALEETFWAIRRFVESQAGPDPLVLVLDDLQWAAPPFLDLLEEIVERSREVPVLLVCTARPDLIDARPGWGLGSSRATTIALEPLDEHDTVLVMAGRLGVTDFPAELGTRITQAAGGNPLFAEELMAMLIDEGAIEQQGDRWHVVKPADDLGLPASIQALLTARLDQLELEDRRVVECASVIGQVFELDALADLVPQSISVDLDGRLADLAHKDLVQPHQRGSSEQVTYRFRHILIRDAAYRGLLKRTRAELHERFAGRVERRAGARLPEVQEIVGYHLEQAFRYLTELGEPATPLARRAHHHLNAAGVRSNDRGDTAAAIRSLVAAASIGEPMERAAAELELGIAYDMHGAPRLARSAFNRAEALAVTEGEVSLARRAELLASPIFMMDGTSSASLASSRARLHTIIGEFEDLGDDLGLSLAWTALAYESWILCRFDDAARAFEKSVKSARRAKDRRTQQLVVADLCFSWLAGSTTVTEGVALARAAVEDLGPGPLGEAVAMLVEGQFASMTGDFERARSLNDRSLAIVTDLGMFAAVERRFEARTEIERRAGDMTAVAYNARSWYERATASGDEAIAAYAAAMLAEGLVGLGATAEAAPLAEIALATSPEEDASSQILGRRVQAQIAALSGDERNARTLIDDAVELCEGVQWPEEAGSTLLARAQVLRLLDDPQAAIASARRALGLFAAKGIRPLEARAAAELAVSSVAAHRR